MDLYKQKCGKTFVSKHCWVLLNIYLHFTTIFLAKWNVGGFDVPTPSVLPVDCHEVVVPMVLLLPMTPHLLRRGMLEQCL